MIKTTTPIIGKSTVTPKQCEKFLRIQNPNAPYLAAIYKKYCNIYGIKIECAWVQMCLETNFLRYSDTSITTLDMHNYAGLGAVDGNGRKQALSFNTEDEGVKCHIQHLYAYCTDKELPRGEILIDSRFEYVTRGIAPNLENLGNGNWASDKEYASKLINLLNQLLNIKEGGEVMVITYDYGHGCGADRGSSGYLNEEKVIREYGPITVEKFKKLGHTLYDCTPPASLNLTLAQSLAYRVNKANSIGSQLHICMHVNAYETDKASGCEVEYASNSGEAYADRIYPEIANALGVQVHSEGSIYRPDLYVLKYTSMVAILIEPFFCDTKADCDKYNAEKLATAIVKGITGIDTSAQINTATTQETTPKYEETVPAGPNIFPILDSFYIEKRTDGDMAIHLDRGNYIVIRKGGSPEVYWNNNQGSGGSKRLF